MVHAPVLVYLHGVGAGDLDDGWKASLETTLTQCGYPSLNEVRVIAPKYPNTLFDYPDDDEHEVPRVLVPVAKGEDGRIFRRELERRTAEMEIRLGPEAHGDTPPGIALAANVVSRILRQADRYLDNDRSARARALKRVLQQIPASGEIVIVGHSLGSVIALDVVRRLPPGVKVRALVTLGSPVGHGRFNRHTDRLELRAPSSNVEWWVNFWGALDPVTCFQGVSHAFPWVLDRRLPLASHKSARYLASPEVGVAIGRALFGSLSKELEVASNSLDVPMGSFETNLVLEDAYAFSIWNHLDGDLRDRFGSALKLVQAEQAAQLRELYARAGLNPPSPVAQLIDAWSRLDQEPVMPPIPSNLSKSDACAVVLGVLQRNPIEPFEIEIKKSVRENAAGDLTASMMLGSKFGRDAMDSFDFATRAVRSRGGGARWWLVGAGAAAIVAATGGLALAAAPGLYGAAAIVSALASFGPGGMLGGLVAAGTLTTSGAAALAVGLARSESYETMESVVVFHVAVSKLRDVAGLDHESDSWHFLTQLRTELVREQTRLAPFSDDDAPSMEQLERKLGAVHRAIECVEKNGWLPASVKDVLEPGR